MMRTIRFALMLAVASCLSTLPTSANVIFFSDFGAGYAYNTGTGILIGSPSNFLNVNQSVANTFTAASGGSVSQIDVALNNLSGDGNATVSLWTNSSGQPGSELGSWDVTATVCCAVVTIPVVAGPSLTAGASYFLAIVAAANDLEVWNDNTQGVLLPGQLISHDGGASWGLSVVVGTSAFDILGGSADSPEPTTPLLLGAGLLGMLAHARKRAVR